MTRGKPRNEQDVMPPCRDRNVVFEERGLLEVEYGQAFDRCRA